VVFPYNPFPTFGIPGYSYISKLAKLSYSSQTQITIPIPNPRDRILSRFCPELDRIRTGFRPGLVQIWVRFGPDLDRILLQFWSNSG